MKLRTKLLLSYLILIMIAFFIFWIISVPLVRNYIKRNVTEGLQQEAVLIKTRTEEALEEVTKRDEYIKALVSERVAIERLGIVSKMGILYFNKNTRSFVDGSQSLQLTDEAKQLLADKITSIDTTPFEIEINGTQYIATYFLTPASRLANQRVIIVVYTPLDAIASFTRGFTRIILLVFLVIIVASVIVSLVFAEKINNPVLKLKKQALDLKKRNFKSRSNIKTGDEFEELSKSMNAAAEELAGYSRVQQEFLDNISHELKTPLMSIQGYAEGIKDGIFPADSQTLDIITDESIRLKKLVSEISYLSKLESMPDFYDFTDVDMPMIIERSIDSISGLKKTRDISISTLDIHESKICGDGEKLLQLMINILSNSVRYAQKTVFIDSTARDDKYIISIKDDGEGFAPGEEEKIFRRFYKGPAGNTGLGLSIAMAIAKSHGGTINAWNASPRGAVFEIILPISHSNRSPGKS
jgi:signal transduction histidine kinase